jgi:predicted nucleic acid-binding protein
MLPWTVRRVIETMKRGEKCSVLIKKTYVKEENPEFWAHILELLGGVDLSDTGFFLLTLELHTLIKVEDWYKDGTTFKRILRKGKGDQPNSDSVVKSK